MVQKRDLSAAKIIAVAKILIQEQGPSALTFAAVAKQLNCRTQALYFYFKNMRDLKLQVARDFFQAVLELLTATAQGLSGEDGVLKLAFAMRTFCLQRRRLAEFVFSLQDLANDSEARRIGEAISVLPNQMLTEFIADPKQRLTVSRGIRALVMGEVFNESAGWFADERVSREISFTDNLKRILAH
ncbi:hypothetical protein IV38_GL001054 [Lactobacillus selangorensis]|uniref:HTH tetR-type domain-containing protein n=1 Tax=Lactobacillus selangorensis TaxID=81857 RepID=A0A0R2FJM6_9LACO|nr:TetR/AcrR family transcriptional regulator [Lactobacillus selangorensis]KRN28847.1 hypothetical protein IV38_GL001054 [Lactobacillus selangorensis]KRN32743.1 hypothetical protein IV40_GL000799 [Lactobacillus selangorensis]